jgi:hypothetical protein
MQVFERLVAGARPAPAALEAFARYLATTGGDSNALKRGSAATRQNDNERQEWRHAR